MKSLNESLEVTRENLDHLLDREVKIDVLIEKSE